MKRIIAPSILAMDFSQFEQQIGILDQSKAEAIHFDVMDGHFVPNLTFGPDLLAGVRKLTNKTLDVHLMVTDPEFFAPKFIAKGADLVTFHVETLKDTEGLALVRQIHQLNCQAGIVLKPGTDVAQAIPYLNEVDCVLIMSVEPGFGGQKFMPVALDKLHFLSLWRDEHQKTFRLEVDGGIDSSNIELVSQQGADMIVAGSYIFKHPQGIAKAIESLL